MLKNKKIAGVVLAGALALGSIGGGAYAYKDEWTPMIHKGVDMLAGYIFKDDIQKEIDAHNEQLKGTLRGDIQRMIAGITQRLQAEKQAEINRGKNELTTKYEQDKARAEREVAQAVDNEVREQQAKTNAKVENEKGELDDIVEAELNKIPK